MFKVSAVRERDRGLERFMSTPGDIQLFALALFPPFASQPAFCLLFFFYLLKQEDPTSPGKEKAPLTDIDLAHSCHSSSSRPHTSPPPCRLIPLAPHSCTRTACNTDALLCAHLMLSQHLDVPLCARTGFSLRISLRCSRALA